MKLGFGEADDGSWILGGTVEEFSEQERKEGRCERNVPIHLDPRIALRMRSRRT